MTEENTPEVPAVPDTPAEPAPAAPDWRAQLGEYADSPALKDTKSVESLAKQFVDQQSYLGRNIQVPDAEATPERWDEFYSKVAEKAPDLMRKPDFEADPSAKDDIYRALGKPKDAVDYALPEGLELQEDELGRYRKAAHDAGLSKDQFAGMMADVIAPGIAARQEREHAIKNSRDVLAQEWGMGTDRKMKEAQRALETFFPGSPMAVADMDGDSIKGFAAIAEAMGRENPQLVTQDAGTMAFTPDEARSKADDILSRINKGVAEGEFYKGSEQYNRLVKKRFDYIQIANNH